MASVRDHFREANLWGLSSGSEETTSQRVQGLSLHPFDVQAARGFIFGVSRECLFRRALLSGTSRIRTAGSAFLS
ncbi:hypothetical protein SDC9_67737 [bioreactor metagenome]|uniref:Uncharacterized protein n=1 Tax=bioreactor metagenome TaxID=1076179 RepID=A0A644Y427_9ZZZZ